MRIVETLTFKVLVDENMRIVPEVLDFTMSLKRKGKSINTIYGYLENLQKFYEWLNIEKLAFHEVKPRHFMDFIRYLDNSHPDGRVSPSTLNRHLAALSSFYKHHEVLGGWVVKSPILKEEGGYYKQGSNVGFLRHVANPVGKETTHFFKRKNRKSKIDRKRLYEEQALTIYHKIDELWANDENLAARNRIIFKILYETGMRIGELLHLQVDDYEYPDPSEKTGMIYLIERDERDPDRQLKSGERSIPVKTELLEEIDRYVMEQRPYVDDVKHLIVNHGNPVGLPTHQSAIKLLFSQLSEASSIKCTAHSLRHTHASNLADMGMDALFIKTRLGHKSIETTAKYVQPSLETQIKAYERFVASLETKEGGF